ncbi:BaiN/RdsA family NAD(P)/FAD-dependent oxidoreductase [Candidatus Contubernalis alkaliaceticus]|uniref:NAD(P)/FAD-dependent oxidoreductase n=1 Tax=Candidatus Contubernalis alkaliaceticus TaxID=338645 RepID=UPI001F4BEF77|nr:NAD(P)/FAD-dependent oxidoreductase [Candidatus Contubernalis alkalaceticus]UNC91937.1 NAD(P)/FAD-dependent oxidoreductase [Candidatus Contubernalis alkalaceticus]
MDVIVIGGGASGMMAAGKAAEYGLNVVLLEKKPDLGRKLLITGKGRCNITNAAERDILLQEINSNPKFLYASFNLFDNQDMISFMESRGVKTAVERGERVFPQSGRSKDVLEAFINYIKEKKVTVRTAEKAQKVLIEGSSVKGVKTDKENLFSKRVILAAGGSSYPVTGSTGDGYKMAKEVGHTIISLRPGLVPLEIIEKWAVELQGLSLKNVNLEAIAGGKSLGSQFGEMLFTHFGISGPIVLTLSNAVADNLTKKSKVTLVLDLKPALTLEQLDLRLQRDFEKYSRKNYKNSLKELLPQKMIPVIIKLSGIPEDKPVNQLSREERAGLAGLLKRLEMRVKRVRPLEEAIVTRGGVKVQEVNPKTLESKLISGLYFSGEVLDIDANTGGYNLQCAFSTGYAAGKAAAESCRK